MGKTCLAGWTELQGYKAAKANKWLWAEGGDFERLLVFWDWRGHTGESGACFWVGLGDQDNDAPDEARLFFPITSPRKATGQFRFKDQAYASQLLAIIAKYPPMAKVEDWQNRADEDITRYERIAAPLGSAAWTNR